MGKLRIEPKSKKPGFTKVTIAAAETASVIEPAAPTVIHSGSTISLKTRYGTTIFVSREVPLKQVARLARLLDAGCSRDLG